IMRMPVLLCMTACMMRVWLFSAASPDLSRFLGATGFCSWLGFSDVVKYELSGRIAVELNG
ncbi:hypothetical protein, partial [Bifidobacterium sp. UBA6881]|uniref:hypothetical protein n=1 Tax=Bifidobacterium sp. UBA6881 TaxID=1946109 RepID=UPI0025B9AD5C